MTPMKSQVALPTEPHGTKVGQCGYPCSTAGWGQQARRGRPRLGSLWRRGGGPRLDWPPTGGLAKMPQPSGTLADAGGVAGKAPVAGMELERPLHTLRHSYARACARSSPLEQVQAALDDSNLATISIYLRLDSEYPPTHRAAKLDGVPSSRSSRQRTALNAAK